MKNKNVIIGVVVIAVVAYAVYYFKYRKPKTQTTNVAPPSGPSKPLAYGIPTMPTTTPTWTQNPIRTTSKPTNPPTEELADPVVVSSVKLTEPRMTRNA